MLLPFAKLEKHHFLDRSHFTIWLCITFSPFPPEAALRLLGRTGCQDAGGCAQPCSALLLEATQPSAPQGETPDTQFRGCARSNLRDCGSQLQPPNRPQREPRSGSPQLLSCCRWGSSIRLLPGGPLTAGPRVVLLVPLLMATVGVFGLRELEQSKQTGRRS